MNDINKKIDDYIRKRRLRNILISVLVSFLALPIILWFLLPPMGPVTEISGVVSTLAGLPTDEGERLYIIVRLDNGKEVRSRITNVSQYKKGKRVTLTKHEPLIFGRTIYRYQSYID